MVSCKEIEGEDRLNNLLPDSYSAGYPQIAEIPILDTEAEASAGLWLNPEESPQLTTTRKVMKAIREGNKYIKETTINTHNIQALLKQTAKMYAKSNWQD